MSKHLLRDMEDLHREILSMSAIVEEMIDKAAQSLCSRRGELASSSTAARCTSRKSA
jgi:phosphate transport system protein